jgi:hypothetical protein
MDGSTVALWGLGVFALALVAIVAIVALVLGRRGQAGSGGNGLVVLGHLVPGLAEHSHQHDHDDDYADVNHDHDGKYARVGHDHPVPADDIRRIVAREIAARQPEPQLHRHVHEYIGRAFSRVAAIIGGLIGLGLSLWSALYFNSSAVTLPGSRAGVSHVLDIAFTHGWPLKATFIVLVTVIMAAGFGWLFGGFFASRHQNDA